MDVTQSDMTWIQDKERSGGNVTRKEAFFECE